MRRFIVAAGLVAGPAYAQDLCDGVVCTQLDACHELGVCVPENGLCLNPPLRDGAPCEGGRCRRGVCVAETADAGAPAAGPAPVLESSGCSASPLVPLTLAAALSLARRRRAPAAAR